MTKEKTEVKEKIDAKEQEPVVETKHYYTIAKPLGVTGTHMTVTINGRTTMIKYNTKVLLDDNIIEVIEQALAMERLTESI